MDIIIVIIYECGDPSIDNLLPDFITIIEGNSRSEDQ